jgi:hypothetical protein
MKTSRPLRATTLLLLLCLLTCARIQAQTVNATQTTLLQGLLASGGHGGFHGAAYEPDGSLILLEDTGDGIRLLKAGSGATTLLAQAHIGATGDHGLAMTLDLAGNIYVTGTTTSGSLSGTSGSAYPARADTSTNGFLARYDANLNLVFLTFLGAGRTAPSAVAATADAAFVTGITYDTAFPVTPAGIQQAPASGSSGNGFVERFNVDGSIVYATYLTGVGGDTSPASIASDTSDNAYIVGQTTASGYPTVAALEPEMLDTTSGFLTRLTSAGDGIVFSTFVAGNGLTSIALDPASQSLLLSGDVSLSDFPVASAFGPIAATDYQSLLRISTDGQSVTASTLLMPGNMSYVAAGVNGDAWVSGTLGLPLFPGDVAPNSPEGNGFLLHVTQAGKIDQTFRFGGLPIDQQSYAALSDAPAAPAVAQDGTTVALAATLTATVDSSLVATQRFDLPFVAAPNTLLPSTPRDLATTCSSGQCTSTGGLLSLMSTVSSAPALGIAADDLPNITLHNLGASTANGLAVAVSGFSQSNDCATTLPSSQSCTLALSGAGPGSLSVSAANSATQTIELNANSAIPAPIAISTDELDFGIVSAAEPVQRVLMISNQTAGTQSFASSLEGVAASAYTFTQTATDCAMGSTPGTLAVAANASCHITLTLAASDDANNDGFAREHWLIGSRDVLLTGFAEAASLSASASELNFGTQFIVADAIRLPRYLFLSNATNTPLAHTTVSLPATSPFGVTDECPSMLPARSVCRLTFTYASATVPSRDVTTLMLDDGLAVLLTGTTLQPATVTGNIADPNLAVSPTSLTFATPVSVTGVSGTRQTVIVSNAGASALDLSIAATDDFSITNGCPAVLQGNASCSIVVAFTPSQPGARQGLLSITGGSNFAPVYVTLAGTATAILPANNGVLDLGQTYAGESLVAWYQVQQAFPALSVNSDNPEFGVAVVEDTGNGHGMLPASSFTQQATSSCASCWLGIQFLSGTPATLSVTLSLRTASGGQPYVLSTTAVALPVTGVLLNPLDQDFGTVAIGSSSAPITFTLTDLLPSSAALNVRSVTASGDFAVTNNSTGGPSCTGSIGATASCFVDVLFTPTATGERSGTLTVVTDNSTVTAALHGFGSMNTGVALNPSALTFANVPGSAAADQTIAVSNTGSTAVSFGTMSSSDTAFTSSTNCTTLAPGTMCSVRVVFTPQSTFASAALAIPVTTVINGQTQSSTYTVPLNGTYAQQTAGLSILPDSANFGAQATGTIGLTREFTLANFSAKQFSIRMVLPQQFPLAADPSACATLDAGSTCMFSVTFVPGVSGEATGTIAAVGTPSDGSVTLQSLAHLIGYGDGSGSLALSNSALVPNAPLNFGTVNSGQTVQQLFTLTNTGATAVQVRRVTSEPPFFSATTCGGTLAAHASCSVTVTYAPVDEVNSGTSTRQDIGQLIVESDATVSPLMQALTGTVVPAVSGSPANGSVLAIYALSNTALTFANTAVGNATPAQTLTLTNTGNRTLQVADVTASPNYTASTTCATLLAGANCTVSVAFTPTTAASGPARPGALEINSDAADALEFVTLFGTSSPAPLLLSSSTLDFGTVNVGATTTLSVTATNTTAAPVTFTGLAATGEYTTAIGTCPTTGNTLAAGASCTLDVTFAPIASGTRTGTLSLSTDATQLPLTVALTGFGAAAKLTVAPSVLAFGTIAVGSPANMTLTLQNTGSVAVTSIATTLSGANAGDFAVTSPCAAIQLAPNQGCTLTVTFTPSGMAMESASLNIVSSYPNSPLVVPMTGSGSLPGGFTLTVDGGTSSSKTVTSGSPALYELTVTPSGGFTGTVALTCAPVAPAQYAACSLLSSSLTLQGGTAQNASVTITTITSEALRGVGMLGALLMLPWWRRRSRRRSLTAAAVLFAGLVVLSGCGGGSPNANSKLRYAPAGTYQYTVTASSTSGPVMSSSVTLNLVVR